MLPIIMDPSSFQQSLDQVVSTFHELQERLADPSVTSDTGRYVRLSREYSSLEGTVNLIGQYNLAQTEIRKIEEQLKNEKDSELIEMLKEEKKQLEESIPPLTKKLQIALLPSDENEGKNVILEIRAGTGGDEAGLFAKDLMRMYLRYAERSQMQVEILEASESGIGGVKEAILLIKAKNAWQNLHFEAGGHRVQRIPSTETNGRIHTSACTVAVIPEAEESDFEIDAKDIRIDVFRASGAGGQHVNKTESAIRLTHMPTGIVVSCQEEKSQHKNKDKAMAVLRARLAEKDRQDKHEKASAEKKAQVGSGDRSEKIRTYNFPQSRVSDHRIGYTAHNLESVMDGNLDDLINAILNYDQSQKLAELEK